MVAAGSATLPGCIRRQEDLRARTERVLYRRLEEEPATLNPILHTSDYEGAILALMTRNLVEVDRNLEIVAGLCDHWDVSPDQRNFTFHLRREARWEDGSPVTSHDAFFTLAAVADPRSPAILYSSGFESFSGVDEIDEKSFRVRFAKASAFRLASFRLPLLPAARFEHRDLASAPENRAPISNGPYRFLRWQTGREIELVRNEQYWDTPPGFDRVVFRLVHDQTQAYRALLRSELDESRLTSEQYLRSRTDPDFSRCCRVLQFDDFSFFYLGYNNRLAAFHEPLTRRALTMLLDRQSIVDRLFAGGGRVLSGPWPHALSAYDPSILPYPFDPARARLLLTEAGWKRDTRGLVRAGARFQFELLYSAGSNISREVAELAAEDFRAAGIECRPLPVEWASLTKRMDSGAFEAVLASWANDLSPDLYECWHSSQAPPVGMNNLSYRNPNADRLIEATRLEPDPSKRLALFHRLHSILHDDEPATWIFQAVNRYAVSRRLRNVAFSPLGLFRFWPGASAWSAHPGAAPSP
jgi:peptide/nickel transport system substrate-binding protein